MRRATFIIMVVAAVVGMGLLLAYCGLYGLYVLLGAQGREAGEPDFGIKGVVVREGGDPLAGATVDVLNGGEQGGVVSTTRTAGDGEYEIHLSPGDYAVVATYEGERSLPVLVTIPFGDDEWQGVYIILRGR